MVEDEGTGMAIDELLAAYAAGELEPAERAAVQAALASAPALHVELARYRRLVVVLAALAAENLPPPGDLAKRIARRLAVPDATP